MLTHPEKIRLELISGLNWMRRGGNDVTSTGIDLICKNQGDRLPHCRFAVRITPNDDFLNPGGHPRRTDAHSVAGFNRATGDTSGKPPEIKVGTVDPLYGHRKRTGSVTVHCRDGLEPL